MAALQLEFNKNINAIKRYFLWLMMYRSPVSVFFFFFNDRLYPKINNTAHNNMHFSLRHLYCITLSSLVTILGVLGYTSELLLKYITCLLLKNYIDYYQLLLFFICCAHTGYGILVH